MKPKYLLIFIILLIPSFGNYAQDVKPISIDNPKPPKRSEIKKLAYIISPKDGSSFTNTFNVNGIVKNVPEDSHLWLVVRPRESNGCWPQRREIIPDEKTGEWNGEVTIGGDDGKLLDILLVNANAEANKFFNDYITNQKKDNFPERPMPEGAKLLTHITVTKAPDDDTTNHTVNKYYGFSKSGVFYIHKKLIEQSDGEIPCLIAGVTNWKKDVKMQSDGDYYIYVAKIDRPYKTNLEYCFYIGNGNYLPQLLLEKSSILIREGDYKINNTKDGNNFYTSPQAFYPGSQQ